MAIHIIDFWHACQHVHEAGRNIHGEGTDKAAKWSQRYKCFLIEQGGLALLKRLKKTRYKDADRQEKLDKFIGYLSRNHPQMRYDEYIANAYPISSGPMESFCKQPGQRLKGPGMRWSRENADPMAAMASAWSNDSWEKLWQPAA